MTATTAAMSTTATALGAETPFRAPANLSSVLQDQLSSLDDTDCYATAWSVALSHHNGAWGGRGRGGRGLARRTVQPKDVVVDDIDLMYVANHGTGKLSSNAKAKAGTDLRQQALLQGAQLRLMHGRVYGLIGRNGQGKSSLLRRLHHRKIPGLSSDITTMYLPQEVSIQNILVPVTKNDDELRRFSLDPASASPIDVLMHNYNAYAKQSGIALQSRIEDLESKLVKLSISRPDIGSDENDEGPTMEQLCDDIAALQEQIDSSEDRDTHAIRQDAADALHFFGIHTHLHNASCVDALSGGQLKKVLLSAALLCLPNIDLLLLDEPNHLDIVGLLQLRRLINEMCAECGTTVLLVSHDVDLLDDVATDIIQLDHQSRTLQYYNDANYSDFCRIQGQQQRHDHRVLAAATMKHDKMHEAMHFIRHLPVPKRGGARKKANAIRAQRKKIERHDIMQQASGIVVDASAKPVRGAAAANTREEEPDKAVQFVFRQTNHKWGGTLITAADLGHGYGDISTSNDAEVARPEAPGATEDDSNNVLKIIKKDNFLFDSIDLFIEEGSRVCLMGPNQSGKSVLMRLLAKREAPLDGTVQHAPGLQVGFFDQHAIDELMEHHGDATALQYLTQLFPSKSEQDLRGELTAFSLGPAPATTRTVRFLSGGERSRLALARLMLDDPSVLLLDNPTANLDVESVAALVYGLRNWNGTIVCVSHDAHFVRSLDFTHSYVLVPEEGKLRRVEGGIDQYLRSFKI